MHAFFQILIPASLFFAAPTDAPDSKRGDRSSKPSMMDRHDADGSGTLSAAEVAGTRIEARFATLDANSDGEVTKAEMKAARKGKRGKDRRMRSSKGSDRPGAKAHKGECGDKADRGSKGKRGKDSARRGKGKRSAKRGKRTAA